MISEKLDKMLSRMLQDAADPAAAEKIGQLACEIESREESEACLRCPAAAHLALYKYKSERWELHQQGCGQFRALPMYQQDDDGFTFGVDTSKIYTPFYCDFESSAAENAGAHGGEDSGRQRKAEMTQQQQRGPKSESLQRERERGPR